MPPEVSIVKCDDYSAEEVYRAIKDSLNLIGGMGRFVKKGERILIKPNLLSAKPVEKAVTTHPAVVKALIKIVKELGATPLVGDSPGMENAFKVAQRCGVMDVCREEGVELVDLKTPVTIENPNGVKFKRFEIAREILGVDGIINAPKLKTHAQMLLTMGVKNIFGCVPGMKKAQWHLTAGFGGHEPLAGEVPGGDAGLENFSTMLLDLYLYINPRLTVMDAIVSLEGNGPGSAGCPIKTGFIGASADAVALDRVMADILGKKADEVPLLKRAMELGIGGHKNGSPMGILGERLADARVERFSFPPLVSVNFSTGLPSFLDRYARKSLTTRPRIDSALCSMCEVCIDVCPAKKMSKKGKDRIVIDYDGCIRCYCCQEMCPEGAIKAKEGWLRKIIPGL